LPPGLSEPWLLSWYPLSVDHLMSSLTILARGGVPTVLGPLFAHTGTLSYERGEASPDPSPHSSKLVSDSANAAMGAVRRMQGLA
jgi:hypothetical protein